MVSLNITCQGTTLVVPNVNPFIVIPSDARREAPERSASRGILGLNGNAFFSIGRGFGLAGPQGLKPVNRHSEAARLKSCPDTRSCKKRGRLTGSMLLRMQTEN